MPIQGPSKNLWQLTQSTRIQFLQSRTSDVSKGSQLVNGRIGVESQATWLPGLTLLFSCGGSFPMRSFLTVSICTEWLRWNHCCNSLPESAGWAESLMSYMKSCVCPSILLLPLPCFWNSGWSLTSILRCYGFFHSLLIGIPFPSLLTSSLPSNPPLICLYCLIPTEHCNSSFSLEWALTLCIVDVPQSPAHWRWNELMVS